MTNFEQEADVDTIERSYEPHSIGRRDFAAMPDDYRQIVVRLMAIQAHGERLAATAGIDWVRKVPGYRERRVLATVLADEARHSALLYRELEHLGVDEDEANEIVLRTGASATTARSMEGPVAVGDPDNDWTDIALNMMLLDRAGRYMIENYCESSYRPWAQACLEILPDEAMHEGFGLAQFKAILARPHDRDALAMKVTRWFAFSLNFFGPPSRQHYDKLRDYGLKRRTNEQMREAYRIEVIEMLRRGDALDLVRLSHDAYPYA